MNSSPITLDATLQPDGMTLQLEKKLALSPGRVTVTVRPSEPNTGPTMLEVLDRIHLDQQKRGQKPMTEQEMESEIAQMRADDDGYEKRWREIWEQTEMKKTKPGSS